MTRVKICGITNLEDAVFAAEAGADALGFNFYNKSPRYIDPKDATRIIKELPSDILKVGVFVNEEIENIVAIASVTSLDAIQLHGNESPEFVSTLRNSISQRIIKVFRVSSGFKAESVLVYEMDTIFLDTYSPAEYGGTGETFNWEIARAVQNLGLKIYLAGGLSPENIANAVRYVGPYGVDACSGLERANGLKDNLRVEAFIKAVKEVE